MSAMERKLAAILAADVVGYSRLIEQDEAGTIAALKDRRTNIFNPLVTNHRGRVVKMMGDGVLVEFASAVNAVQCAVQLQQKMGEANTGVGEDRPIVLRVGINLGDVVVDGSDIYGDGVNIAARLEGIAEPGTVCISGTVYDQVKNKLKLDYEELGPQSLLPRLSQADITAVVAYTFANAVRPHLNLAQEAPSLARFAARCEERPIFRNAPLPEVVS
jgi:class 3 adenylate cyclase